jgi:hypothetical protein
MNTPASMEAVAAAAAVAAWLSLAPSVLMQGWRDFLSALMANAAAVMAAAFTK